MSSVVHYPHISAHERGTAWIGRTRYKVIHLAAEHYHYGWSAEELIRQHPELQPEEVCAALTYFYDHHDTLVSPLEPAEIAGSNTSPCTKAESSVGLSGGSRYLPVAALIPLNPKNLGS